MYYRIFHISTIILLCLSLVSCTKETNPNKNENSKENKYVVIKVNQVATKTYLEDDGVSPKFQEGDSISVINGKDGSVKKYAVVINDKQEATIEVDTSGFSGKNPTLYYPADKVAVSKKGSIVYCEAIVPGLQTGKFKDANICAANDINFDSGYAYFMNAVSLLKFDLRGKEKVSTITIETIDVTYPINTSNTPEKTIVNDVPENDICYIAIKAINLIPYFFITVGDKMKTYQNINLNTNTIYTVNLNSEGWEDVEY